MVEPDPWSWDARWELEPQQSHRRGQEVPRREGHLAGSTASAQGALWFRARGRKTLASPSSHPQSPASGSHSLNSDWS